ncbi:hypothetical protein QNO07_09385 [Streptomyces sp. 549]|uniref:hypothetical protein n=1 Tax=Streptomyces sp. 549 TaxID=3049076 RepID=UPI0024C3B0D5|nr:hypothetical protein [Streptomyces sp. 549]MDK1473631.1 hypothetical protein [Streptomyces sp. 549]
MAYTRTSRISETPDGQWVYAETDEHTNTHRVVCSGCPDLKDVPHNSRAGAILAASYHAEHDPNQQHVPTRKQ